MGLFNFFKNNTLKAIEWLDNSKDTIVYRYPMDGRSIMWGSKLTVRASQVAIFVNKGKIADVFSEGIYSLSTSNLPILTQLLALPYGFKSPFYSEVYFINLKQFTNQKWGTSNPVTMRDPEFGTIRIRAFGTYSFKVDDPKKLLEELFGTNARFETGDISEHLKSMIVSTLSDTIAEANVSALDMSSNLLEFNKMVSDKLVDKFKELGLKIVNMIIENISFPEQVEKAIDTKSSLGVIGGDMDKYMKYQTASSIPDMAKNNSTANAGVGLGTGLAMADMIRESIKGKDSKEEKSKDVCPKCGCEVSSKAKFCPECGAKLNSKKYCPSCGAENKSTAKFCGECGKKL